MTAAHLALLVSTVLWTDHLDQAVYTTASMSTGGHVFAGTWLNPPREARLYAPDGGGAPEWGHTGTRFFVDAADEATVVGSVDLHAAGIDISLWSDFGDAAPDWTATFPAFSVTDYGPIAISDDGSTLAVTAAPSGTDAHLLLFDAGSSTPIADHVAAGLGFPRYMKISADGRFPAMIALATLVVYDRDQLAVREAIPMGATNSAMDISGNGDRVAFGWQSMQVRSWDGAAYALDWSFSNPGTSVSKIALSDDGTTIISTWSPNTNNTIRVVVHDASSSTPLWTHDYLLSAGTVQELAFDIDATDDGRYFVVGSLGDDLNLNPEVHIFQRDVEPHVYDTYDMPGSVFSVDITGDGRYVTAAGKAVHANTQGRGGAAVLLETNLVPVSVVAAPSAPPAPLGVSPNPFVGSTSIDVTLEAPGALTLSVFDVRGRLRRVLARGVRSAGSHRVTWDGRDAAGQRLPSGVYYVELLGPGGRTTQRLVALD